MRVSKKVGPVTVRASSSGRVGMSVGAGGTRISTSSRKGKEKGKLASGCAGIVLLFIVIAVILAMCSPKDKDDTPDTDTALSVAETVPETTSRSLPAAGEDPAAEEETPSPVTEEPEVLALVPEEAAEEEPVTRELPAEEPAVEEPAVQVEETPAQTEVWIANTNTKKLHYTWCQYVDDIKEENKMWVTEPEKMLEWGYTWCSKCHG